MSFKDKLGNFFGIDDGDYDEYVDDYEYDEPVMEEREPERERRPVSFTRENLKRTMLAQETVLRFVKQYADNEEDYELLMKHFHDGKTYMQMADEMFYCERTIINKVNQAIKMMTEKAKDVEAFPY